MTRRVLLGLRHLLGIRDYAPGAIPPALVWRPTWYGARGRTNGHTPRWFERYTDPVIARLTQQHRLIRQMIADADRARRRDG